MDPIVVLPAKQLQELIERFEQATAILTEIEKQLAALKRHVVVEEKKANPKEEPDKFAQFDRTCEIQDRICRRHIEDRDRAIDKLRAEGKP